MYKPQTKLANNIMASNRRRHASILRPSDNRRGIGLFSHIRNDTTTAFQDFFGFVLGIFFLALAAGIAIGQLQARAHEFVQFGSAESHIGGFILAGGFAVVAFFFSHVAAIRVFRKVISMTRRISNHAAEIVRTRLH